MKKVLCILTPLYICVGILIYWCIDSFWYPTEVLSAKLLTEEVYPGQNVYVDTLAKRYKACSVNRTHIIISSTRQITLSADNHGVIGEKDPVTVHSVVTIPPSTQPGKYRFLIQTLFYCNPLDHFITRHRTINYGILTILPPKELDK